MANEARFEVYPQLQAVETLDAAEAEPTGEFGWRFRAGNGQISAVGGEGFTRREDAHRAVADFLLSVWEVARVVKMAACTGCERPIAYDALGEKPPILDVDE